MKAEKITIEVLAALLLAVPAMAFCDERKEGLASWWDQPWRFHVKGYGWLPNAPADIDINQRDVANLPESLNRILADLDMTAMAEFEVHKGRLGSRPSITRGRTKSTSRAWRMFAANLSCKKLCG